jgi:glycosyltransferase involved in cell wall biosynthesis
MRVLWINEAADFVGGCEQYIYNTVGLLRGHGVRSSLLYDCRQPRFSTDFVEPFDQAFPLVDVRAQVADIAPDLIYVHRLTGRETIIGLCDAGVPAARFFHDYQLFCPREHRYSVLGLRTCRKPIGLRCYFPCLGVVNRTDARLGFRLNRVGKLRAAIRANRELDAFVVGSRYMAGLIAAHGFDPKRTHVLPLYSLPPGDIPPAARQPGLFLFAGQLIRSKGVDTLLHAMARTTHPCRLVIAGQGRQEGMFRGMADTLGVEERVTFLGRIPHEELSAWYCKAACVVVPSRYPETFGLIGPEAMRYGAPVIATDVGAIREWLEDGVTGVAVPPNDPDAMARAMDRMLADPVAGAEMGQAGQRKYEEEFRPERHIDALLRFFQTMAHGDQPRAAALR